LTNNKSYTTCTISMTENELTQFTSGTEVNSYSSVKNVLN